MATTTPVTRMLPKGPFVRTGDWLFKYRNLVFPVVMFVAIAGFKPVPLLGEPAADGWLDAIGFAIVALGGCVRAWVIGFADIRHAGAGKKIHADALLTEGMFSVCRNPLYVGNALVLFGLTVVHNNPAVYAISVASYAFAYGTMIAAEEYFLRVKFGAEFDEYCRTVNRLWPDFSRYRELTRVMRFDWRRALIKDYFRIYLWFVVGIALVAYERLTWGLVEPTVAALWPFILAISVATLAVVVVRASIIPRALGG